MLGAARTTGELVREQHHAASAGKKIADAGGLCRVIDVNCPHSMAVPDFDDDLRLAETKSPPFGNSSLGQALKLAACPFLRRSEPAPLRPRTRSRDGMNVTRPPT